MTDLKEMLEDTVKRYNILGNPALMERFILRNGRAFTPQEYTGRRLPKKECFQNSYRMMDKTLRYCEGFAYRDVMPLHHAWLVDREYNVIDPTWDEPEKCQYFGLWFPSGVVHTQARNTGVYGILDTGRGYNTEFMFMRDPELRSIFSEFTRVLV